MDGRRDEEEAARLWREAAGEVEPLPERPVRIRRGPRRGRESEPAAEAERLVVAWHGEHVEGRAGSAGEEALHRIHRGRWPIDLRLDLHGLGETEARDLVRSALRRALRSKLAGVLVVHGRGSRSPAGPVLKAELPRWLAEPPHGGRVLAFSSAGPHGGRGGATLVALRP